MLSGQDKEFYHELNENYPLTAKQNPDAEIFPQKLVLTPRTKNILKKIAYLLEDGENILLIGDAGVGKNALLYYLNALRYTGTLRYSFSQEIVPEEIIGSFSVHPEHNKIEWNDGGLVYALKKDLAFIADELNLCTPDLLKRFSSLLANGYLEIYEKDSSVVKRGQYFAFLATQNPQEGFEGRKPLPREIARHFSAIYIEPHSEEELIEILSGLYPLPQDFLHRLVRLALSLERLLHDGELGYGDYENYHYNLRNLKRLGERLKAYQIEGSQKGGPEKFQAHLEQQGLLPYFWQEFWDIFGASFRKEEDQNTVKGMIQEHLPYIREHRVESVALSHDDSFLQIGRSILPRHKNDEGESAPWENVQNFPLSKQRGIILERIAAAVAMQENLLLEGPADAELEGHVQWLAYVLGRPYHEITIGRETSLMDLVGSIRPTDNGLQWVDGPLTRGIREDGFIALRGVELAGAEIIEKLNMLTDDARMLLLPAEAGENKALEMGLHGRIFAINYLDSQRKNKKLSRAFRNRFTSIYIPEIENPEDLQEMLFHYTQWQGNNQISSLIHAMVQFHITAQKMARGRRIGAENNVPYEFGWQNLRRWADTLEKWRDLSYQKRFVEGAQLYYSAQISHPKDRSKLEQALQQILANPDAELESLLPLTGAPDKEEKGILSRYFRSSRDLEKKKPDSYFNKDRAKYESYGPKRHKGLNIRTPETGGNIKEGNNAFYGRDTQGFRGYGEGGTGGGGMAYRSEELLAKVRQKRRNLWDYHVGISLEDFNKTFYSELERLIVDLKGVFEAENPPQREFSKQGSRVHFSRYLAYTQGKEQRIFEKRLQNDQEERDKPAIVFVINKGRRIFNYDFALEAVVSLFAAAKVLDHLPLYYSVWGYSNFHPNHYRVDMHPFNGFDESLTDKSERHLFQSLADKWDGRNIAEGDVAERIRDLFPVTSGKKLLVWLSDFRGEYSKKYDDDYWNSFDFQLTGQTLNTIKENHIEPLLLGMGTRALAPWLHEQHILISEENINTFPAFFIKELVRKIL